MTNVVNTADTVYLVYEEIGDYYLREALIYVGTDVERAHELMRNPPLHRDRMLETWINGETDGLRTYSRGVFESRQ